MITKICTKCKKEKPLSEFNKQKGGKYGVRGQCKKCFHKYVKSYRDRNKKRNRKKVKAYSQKVVTKICPKCKIEKPLSEFYEDNSRKLGVRCYCKLCIIEIRKIKYQKNPKRYKEYVRNYNLKNRKKLKEKRNKLRNRKRKYIHDYKSQKVCEICGEDDPIVLAFHHINPNDKKYVMDDLIRERTCFETFLKRFDEEVRKCKILCANCHLRIHYKERNNNI